MDGAARPIYDNASEVQRACHQLIQTAEVIKETVRSVGINRRQIPRLEQADCVAQMAKEYIQMANQYVDLWHDTVKQIIG